LVQGKSDCSPRLSNEPSGKPGITDLRYRVERPVLDNTGLTGNFDFDLTYDLEPLSTTPSGVPPLFEALEKQLGLKLVSKRGPVPVLVIDHVERPAPN
jgi:uncharacterized protein (TIGR03435 family)